MFRANRAKVVDGVTGNARITAATAVVLLVLLTAEGVTIPWIGSLRGPHIFIGMLLLGPMALKLASTGYRFLRYYSGTPPYLRKGPPPLPLRLLAPGVVVTTVALFATGVALLIAGPGSDQLSFLHKVSFIAWFAFMALHVLGHLLELPRLASADWRRAAPPVARVAGAGLRILLVTAALAAGLALAFVGLALSGPWLG